MVLDEKQLVSIMCSMEKRRIKKPTLSEQLRAAIESSGLTRYRISQETGIDQAALSRFMSGEMGLSTNTLDKMADVLGLELVVKKRNRR